MTTVATFEILWHQCLNHTDNVVQTLLQRVRDSYTCLPLYRTMHLTREFYTQAVSRQRTDQLGTYASSLEQEAVSVAMECYRNNFPIYDLPYRPSSAFRQLLHSPAMRLLSRLEYERSFSASWGTYFVRIPRPHDLLPLSL